jgi:transcriptional regulator with XRE-family HTH domain
MMPQPASDPFCLLDPAGQNVSREYVGYVERGKNKPTVKIFIKLCNAMGVYAPDLLKRVVPPRKIQRVDHLGRQR